MSAPVDQPVGQISQMTPNPYTSMLFPVDGFTTSLKESQSGVQENAAKLTKKIHKTQKVSMSEYVASFFPNEAKYSISDRTIGDLRYFPEIEEQVELPAESERSEESHSTPYESMPVSRTTSGVINTIAVPESHYLKPPKLWGKINREPELPEVEEASVVAEPIKRKRGRPRKNPLPSPSEYVPKPAAKPKKERMSASNIEIVKPEPERPPPSPAKVVKVEVPREEPRPKRVVEERVEEESEPIVLPELRQSEMNKVTFPDSEIGDICGHRGSHYLVRMKGASFNEVQWMKREELSELENGDEMLRCFGYYGISSEKPYFNPLFCDPERILMDKADKYLVKWTGLGCKYATWIDGHARCTESVMSKYVATKNRKEESTAERLTLDEMKQEIEDMFSLDETQLGVVHELYEKFFDKASCVLYGNVGSILRLEYAALITVLKLKHNIYGPFLLVVDDGILELAVNEMEVYTELNVLGVPNDPEEVEAIEESMFDIAVVSANAYNLFIAKFKETRFRLACVDGSEIYGETTQLEDVQSDMSILIKERGNGDEEVESQDDSTFIHTELTLFCPMLAGQKELYDSILRENMELLTQNPDDMTYKSRLYEVVTHLSAAANFPSMMNIQDIVIRGNTGKVKDKKFGDCGKMRVVRELINYSQNTKQRLMIMFRDPAIMDVLELYCSSHGITAVSVGQLSKKRKKLDDVMPEAKSNKRIIVLAQFDSHEANWFSIMADIIVVFDGVYNPMYYLSRMQRRPKRRESIIIRLLSANTHEQYLGACADHYDDVPMHNTLRAAAISFMRPPRESAERMHLFPVNQRFNRFFYDEGLNFQYLFDEDAVTPSASPRVSRTPSRKLLEPAQLPPPKEERKPEPEHRPHKRTLVRRYRLEKGATPEKPLHGSISIRRHKYAKVKREPKLPPLRFIEFPGTLEFTEADAQHVWSLDEVNNLLLGMTRFVWGQWERLVAFTGVDVSPAAVKLCCYRILEEVCESSAFPVIDRVLRDFETPVPMENFECVNEIAGSIRPSTMNRWLCKIEHMICAAVMIAGSPDLMSIPVMETPANMGCEWTPSDDRHLIWLIWQYGLAGASYEGDCWSTTYDALLGRVLYQLDSIKQHINEIEVPEVLPCHHIPNIAEEQSNPVITTLLQNIGLSSLMELSALSGCPLETVRSSLLHPMCDIETVKIVDFFDRIREELAMREKHYTEDVQYLEALLLHGFEHAKDSALIQTITDSSAPSPQDLKFFADEIFDRLTSEIEPQFDSIGGLQPILPLMITARQRIIDLGCINPSPEFHNEHYIYPVGYSAETQFPSCTTKGELAVYQCLILSSAARNGPVFRVVMGDLVCDSATPEEAWREVSLKVQEVQEQKIFEFDRTPGHELFGLAAPLTLRLIQAMPGADQCEHYVVRTFKTPYFALKKTGVLQPNE